MRIIGERSPSKVTRLLVLGLFLVGLAAGGGAVQGADRVVTIDDFRWLVGAWQGEGLGGTVEEIWSPPKAGVMVGTFRLMKDDEVVFYEILTLSERDGRIQMRLRHFTPELVGWEEKDEYVTFDLDELEPGIARLGPLEIRHSADRLSMRLKMKGADGVIRTESLEFERFSLTP